VLLETKKSLCISYIKSLYNGWLYTSVFYDFVLFFSITKRIKVLYYTVLCPCYAGLRVPFAYCSSCVI
jgi:hypothetical protein